MRLLWSSAAVAALLWPAHAVGLFDGIPLDGRAEALLVGLALPVVWWLDRTIFDRVAIRVLVIGLLALKVASGFALTQEGFCTTFRAERPIVGQVEAIQFDDAGADLPSWDVRAWPTHHCSAVTARPYASRADFPAWFVNLLDNTNPPQTRVDMQTSGFVVAGHAGVLGLLTAPSMNARLEVDGRAVAAASEGRYEVALAPGTHAVSVTAVLAGSSWMFVPSWDGADLWRAARVTIAPPSAFDTLGGWYAAAIAILAIALMAWWTMQTARNARLRAIEWTWIVAASAALAWLGRTRFDRPAVLLLFGVLCLPGVVRRANIRGAFLLVGIPWLALFAGSTFDQIARFSVYTRGNDWLTYQISAYRIYQFGAWLDAGEQVFYYQPLYRWICGALHLVFGDSSVGEWYWDAACLLSGALVALHVAAVAGRRWAIAAAVTTLSVASLGPVWYLIGRGLSEISAAGFAALAALWLFRASGGRMAAAAIAGVFAVLAYYTRLNHMLFAGGLVALAVPLRVPARALLDPARVWDRLHSGVVPTYATVLVLGLGLLAARTWHYTGRFSVFYGTSLGLNYTGFEPAKVLHSVFATSIGNESFDVRGLPILFGLMAALLAVLQLPGFSSLPLGASVASLSGVAGALIAHAHGYPGRFSVHLLPLTSALSMATVGLCARWCATTAALRSPKPAADVLASRSIADRAR